MSELTVLICASLSGLILWLAFKKKTRELLRERKFLDDTRKLIGMHLKKPGPGLATLNDFQDALNNIHQRARLGVELKLVVTTPLGIDTLTPTDGDVL